MRGGSQREFWHTVANLFPTPHRPTKLLIEPAACKSLQSGERAAPGAAAGLAGAGGGVCGGVLTLSSIYPTQWAAGVVSVQRSRNSMTIGYSINGELL